MNQERSGVRAQVEAPSWRADLGEPWRHQPPLKRTIAHGHTVPRRKFGAECPRVEEGGIIFPLSPVASALQLGAGAV